MAGNLLWLAVSLLLATGVWYIAVTSADPIAKRSFRNIPIQIVPSDSAEMTNSRVRTASVTIQGLAVDNLGAPGGRHRCARRPVSFGTGHTFRPARSERVTQPDTESFRRLVSLVQPAADHRRVGAARDAREEDRDRNAGERRRSDSAMMSQRQTLPKCS